ncbi:unnamed protein product [Caenorhabditis brenneri]
MGHETQSRITKTHYQQLYASEPIYELCIYMSALKNFSNFHVSEMDLDDCTNVMYICADPIPRIAMLNVCFQQVQFHATKYPSQTSIRCLWDAISKRIHYLFILQKAANTGSCFLTPQYIVHFFFFLRNQSSPTLQ